MHALMMHYKHTAKHRLQQHFNKHTFQEEESVYRDEKITFSHTAFIDNQPVVDLIEKKPYGASPLLTSTT
jgi:myosin heavy subunit